MSMTWEQVEHVLRATISRITVMEFWTNQLARKLYGGYRDDARWRGRSFPMDN